jgi:hypothetical protein
MTFQRDERHIIFFLWPMTGDEHLSSTSYVWMNAGITPVVSPFGKEM